MSMNLGEEQRMRGVLTIEVTDAAGAVVETRRVPNLITTAGKELLAKLIMGKLTTVPSGFSIAVGLGDADPSLGDAALASYLDRASATTDVAIVATDRGDVVRAVVTAKLQPLMPDAPAQLIREAGILITTANAEEILFNRVKFAPVTRGPMVVLHLAWEISF